MPYFYPSVAVFYQQQGLINSKSRVHSKNQTEDSRMKLRHVHFAILLLATAANSSLAQVRGGVTPIERPDFWESWDFLFQFAWFVFDIVMLG